MTSDFEDSFENDITTRSSQESSSESQENKAKGGSIFSLEFYQRFFDVETDTVLQRLLGLTLPNRASGIMEKTAIHKNPDLYGPIWTVATLIFMIAVSGNLADFFQHQGAQQKWHYNFHLLSVAATIIISYVILVPLGIWAVLTWYPKQELPIDNMEAEEPSSKTSLLTLVCCYGYSLAIYIPVSILWTVQVSLFQWVLMISAATASGMSLLIILRPSLTKSKFGFGLTLGVVGLHLLLAVGLMMYFFHSSSDSAAPVEKAPNLSPTNKTG